MSDNQHPSGQSANLPASDAPPAPAPAGTAPRHPVDVFLLLTDANRVLLGLRSGTGYADGQWVLPSGKLEVGEDAISAVIRETREEIGLRLPANEPRLTAVVHHRPLVGIARVGLVFAVSFDRHRHGEPVNAEPHKCAKIGWFARDQLPTNTYPYSAAGVHAARDNERLVLSGWS
jgi:8-oxo-dGTP diphosphatase